MESSSSSQRRNEEHNAFSGIEPHGTRRKVDESSRLFDVFINHRGPDVKQKVALKLYNSLMELGIHTYLDSKEKKLGDSFPSTIENAIHSASIHIAIFSKRYAESPWCLAELVLMLQSRAKIIPLFYGVKPSDLRFVEKGKYAKAFTKYVEKKRYMEKLNEWKEALQSVSLLTGHEISSNFNISESQNIVSAVQKEFQRKKSLHVAKYPVGLHRLVKDFERLCLDNLVEDFERQCQTNEGGKEKAQIVGVFGMGGVGKTTLAKELFNRKRPNYTRECFLFDVREAYANNSFPSLQMKLLKDLFQKERVNFQSMEEGKTHIADCIEASNQLSFLIVVDDIDHVQQLDALLIMDILKKSVDSLAIVTTRDAGVLISTGITVAYNLKGMDREYARELFCWHAFGQPYPADDYENLVNSFLNVCGGLPLSLQVLGSHVHGRDQNYWSLELSKISKTLPRHIHQRLKISFDALDYEEQQIFMDIACFFVDKLKSTAIEVWKSSGLNSQHALETLKNKCLVQEIEGRSTLRMHDHLRDLGREMADRLSPRRLWHPRDLECLESKGFQNILAQTKDRCYHSFIDKSMNFQITYFLGGSDVIAETATFLFWLEVEYSGLQNHPSIPTWIPLQNLRCLIIRNLCCKTFWQNPVQTSTLSWILSLLPKIGAEAPTDLRGISNSLEKLTLDNCKSLKTLQGLSGLKKLRELNISNCLDLQELSVVHLCYLEEMDISRCPAFKQLRLVGLNKLKCFRVDYSLLLECFELHDCRELDKIPRILDLGKLVSIDIRDCPKLCSLFIEGCGKLISFQLFKCQNLEQVCIGDCPELEVLSSFERQTSLEKIAINRCVKLKKITLPPDFVEIVIDACRKLKTVAVICDRSEFLKVQELSSVARLNQLKSLSLFNCPELEELSCSTLLSHLKRITIESCDKLRSITLPPELDELVIEGCRELKIVAVVCDRSECLELEELSGLARLSLLKWITIQSCDKLHIIQGIDELHRLQSLHLSDCPELEELPCSAGQTCLESFSIVRCGNLHNIVLPPNLVELIVEGCRELITVAVICDHNEFLRCLKRITIQSCDKLQTIEGIDEFHALENFLLSNCPEFEELSCSAQLNHLKWITIERCNKLHNISLPKTLVELVIEGCRELKTVGVVCDRSEGLERQELSCVLRILNCHKVQTIEGTNELHGLTMELLYCSSTAIRNCISMFKSVPSEFLVMIGRAVDGALSILNPNFFSDADAVIPAISKIHTNASDGRTLLMSRFSVIIFCYVVVVNGGHLVEMINQSLAKRSWSNYRVEEGEWVITIVIADLHKASLHNRRRQLQDVLVEYGILKQGYKVAVKNGKWSKTRRLLLRIGEKLYHKTSAS